MKKFVLAILLTRPKINQHFSSQLWVALTCALIFSSTVFAGLGDIPVQDDGRIKPYDTFAREILHLMWGKETYNGRQATDVVLTWMLMPTEWDNTPFLLIRHNGLREAMKLENARLYFSPNEIIANTHLNILIQDLKNKEQAQEKLDPFYSAVQTLEGQLSAYQSLRSGRGLKILPSRQHGQTTWQDVVDLEGQDKGGFQDITSAFITMASAAAKNDPAGEVAGREKVNQAVDKFISDARAKYGDYAGFARIKAETTYNKLEPFRWAWVCYFIALCFFAFGYFGTKPYWLKIGWSFTGLALLCHLTGFAFRIYILQRPPVSNMFETVVWVSFVTVVLASILYRISRSPIIPVAATMVATLGLILCDVSSSVLDSSLMLLQPVLRDNFWLMTHVIIIVSSYAAFFLAFFIGDIVLFYHWRDEKKYLPKIQEGAQAIYRCIQVGTVLLAGGIILGGVWADYSWGRFWGWDPKETWAFIALMGYVIVLHGRLAGWLRNFGLAAAAVISFSLVIMSWYGVNFVLGAGLHTYGFGAGGVEYVASFVALHILYVCFVITLRQSRIRAANIKSANT
jgi:ABC-type transport system involved in cytochrome c biogenesis permease subunit